MENIVAIFEHLNYTASNPGPLAIHETKLTLLDHEILHKPFLKPKTYFSTIWQPEKAVIRLLRIFSSNDSLLIENPQYMRRYEDLECYDPKLISRIYKIDNYRVSSAELAKITAFLEHETSGDYVVGRFPTAGNIKLGVIQRLGGPAPFFVQEQEYNICLKAIRFGKLNFDWVVGGGPQPNFYTVYVKSVLEDARIVASKFRAGSYEFWYKCIDLTRRYGTLAISHYEKYLFMALNADYIFRYMYGFHQDALIAMNFLSDICCACIVQSNILMQVYRPIARYGRLFGGILGGGIASSTLVYHPFFEWARCLAKNLGELVLFLHFNPEHVFGKPNTNLTERLVLFWTAHQKDIIPFFIKHEDRFWALFGYNKITATAALSKVVSDIPAGYSAMIGLGFLTLSLKKYLADSMEILTTTLANNMDNRVTFVPTGREDFWLQWLAEFLTVLQ